MTKIVRVLCAVVAALSLSACAAAIPLAGSLAAQLGAVYVTQKAANDGLLTASTGSSTSSAGQLSCLAGQVDNARARGATDTSSFRAQAVRVCYGEISLAPESTQCLDKQLEAGKWRSRKVSAADLVQRVMSACSLS